MSQQAKHTGHFNVDIDFIKLPPEKWEWNVFGGDPPLMTVATRFDVPLWRRLLTRVLLGSRWKRL